MPKYSNGKQRRLPKTISFLFFAGCIALCAFLAQLVSSFITAGNFSLGQQSTAKTGFTVYAISLSVHQTEPLALAAAEETRKKGGAGFVWQDGGVFHNLASSYPKENDALLVQQSLRDEGFNPQIFPLTFPEAELVLEDAKQRQMLINALSFFQKCYEMLYDISISFDTAVRGRAESLQAVSELVLLADSTTSSLQSADSPAFLRTRLRLGTIKTALRFLQFEENLAAGLKYNCFVILDEYNKLLNELTK